MKEFEEALKKDRARLSNAGFDWERVTALRSLGETYLEMGDFKSAEDHLRKALEYAEDGRTKAKIRNLLKTITVQ